MSEATPKPWKVEDNAGAGLEIKGVLPAGFNFTGVERGASGKTWFNLFSLASPATVLISCERWVQFETKEWDAMQTANAELIVRAVNSHDDLVAALKEFIECVQRVDPGVYNDTIDMAIKALAKAEGGK